MRNLLLASVAILALGTAPAFAQSNDADTNAAIGGSVGGTTGAAAGFFIGGPVGAVIGGFTGALIGSEAGVNATTIDYASNNPVDLVTIESGLEIGSVLDDDIDIYPVEGDDEFGYIYANNRVYIVNLESREIVQSPGYLVPRETIDYIEANPVASISFDGELTTGLEVGDDVDIIAVPSNPSYGYVYVNDEPVLIDLGTRRVIYLD
jgi:hypothetical protein